MPDAFDAIQQTVAQNQAAAAPPRDAFAEISGQAEPDPLRAVANLGAKMDPARAARVVSLRDRTRLPADLIDRNLDEVEAEASKPDFDPDAYRKASPKVAAWLEQPEHFALAKDDLPRLAAIERMVSTSNDYAWDKGGSILGPMVGGNRTYYRSTSDLLRSMKERQNLDIVDRVQRTMRAEQAQDRGAFTAGFLTAGGSSLRAVKMLAGQDTDNLKRRVERIGEASVINDPGFWNDVQRGLGGLAADMPLMVAGAALAPLTRIKTIMGGGKLAAYGAAAAATAIAVQPLALREGLLTGADEDWANGLASWGIETVIPAAFGTTGTEKIIAALAARGIAKEAAPSLARVAGRLLLDGGMEATEEGVTELAHALHEVASGINPGALDPDQLWPRLAVAGAVGGIAGSGFNLPQAISSMAQRGGVDRETQRLLQAATGQQQIAGILDAAAVSTTAGRSPEAGKTLFQSLVNDSVPSLYVDREAWDAHFQALGQDPRAKLAEYGGDPKAYDEAAKTGSPLILQTGHLAVGVAKDKPTQEWIAAEARLDPAMMNSREAGDALKAMETVADDPEAKVQQTAQEAAQAVLDDVEQQLTNAGYDAGSARRSATQMAAVFRTMAARWNAGRKADDPNRTDARQLFMEWNIGINRPLAEVLTSPTTKGAESIIAARRARLASDEALAGMSAERTAAQSATDQALAQEAAGDAGFALIQEATAVLEDAGEQMTMGDAMRAMGPAFGFRPDSTAAITPEQAKRGNLLAAALRVRGKSLADLIQDAGVAKPDPLKTTAADPTATTATDPALEKLAADALRLRDLVMAIRAGKGDLAELEQASALAAEVGPMLERLPLDQQRIDEVRGAVEFAQEDGKAYNQPAYHGTGNSQPYDRFAYDRVGGPGGEGAQAYGWGLYFAGKKEVAKHYKEKLSTWDGVVHELRGAKLTYAPGGKLYTVEIPEDKDLLDWDKPFKDQPAHVRKALEAIFKKNRDEGFLDAVKAYDAGNTKAMKERGGNIFDYPGATGALYKRIAEIIAEDSRGRGNAEKKASDLLLAQGVPGIRYLDQMSRDKGEGSRNYVIFDDSKVTIKSYEQRKDKRRGSITFGRKDGNRQTDIRLFEHADLSTVLHESGHLYLELLIDLSAREGVPQEIKDDLSTALSWLGVDDPKKIRVEHHEKWARGFESYLMEGKAPSDELRSVFARFSAWLTALYKSIKALSVDLSPEVRGVMDRLLATQEEIAEARNFLVDDPIFPDAVSAGMSPEQFAAYQKARDDSRRQAEDELRTKLMAEITREQSEHWKEMRDEVGVEVELEVNRDKAYVAQAVLKMGTLPGGVPLPPNMPAIKLDTADLKRRMPDGKAPKSMLGMHAKEGGLPADQAAKILGFASADELIQTMAGLRSRRQLIEAETDIRMRQRFGDIMTDGSIAEEAMASLHNEKKADVHLAEVRALATKVGRKAAPIEIIREAARRKVASMPVKDLLPQIHARAEAKARRALEAALAKQDFVAAWTAKQQELLASEMYRAAVDAKREAEQIREHAKKFAETKTRERIGKAGGWEWTVTLPDGSTDPNTYASEDEARAAAAKRKGSTFARTSGYLEQIDGLMERYEFRRVSVKALNRREGLRAWVAQMMAQGTPVNIPDSVLNGAERANWRAIPLAELRGVRDSLAHIAHLAKTKNALSKAQRERELDATAKNLSDTLARTVKRDVRPEAGAKAGWWPSFIAAHRKAANMARDMDGDEDAGPFWDALIRPFNEAATAEATALREAKTKQEALWSRWAKETKNDGWPPDTKREFDGFKGGLSRFSAIMVALNWGNEGNRQRLMEGGQSQGKLNERQIQAVLDSLNAADWNLVEDIWSHIDSYWSDIAALEQRVTGLKPEKVDPSPFPTKHGTIRGGYFPIVYSGQETGRIDGEATDIAKQIQAQAFGRTATAHGHTKARSIGQGRMLNLDAGVIGQHLTKVIHDLTHREALADAMRILLHEDVRGAIDARMGSATTKALRQWIADIATGGQPPDSVQRGISLLRRGFSISTMGFRTMSAAVQLTGFSNSAVRVGPARMAKAIATLFSQKDGQAAWSFVTTRSAAMRERGQTQTREMNEILGQFQRGTVGKFQEKIGTYAFWMMQQVQGVVDRATWLAAYEKAMDEGRTEQAVAIADQTVLDTQSGGQTKDLAGVQRGPYGNLLTGAYTYGSLVFNQIYDQGARVRRNPRDAGVWAGAFGNLMLATALPAALTAMVRALLRDDWPDDEKDSIAERIAVEFGSTLLGTMIGFRELGGVLSGYDYGGPAVLKTIKDLYTVGKQAEQMEVDAGLGRALLDSAGSTVGLPSGQIWATGSGLVEWLEDPSADLRAPVFGPAPKRR